MGERRPTFPQASGTIVVNVSERRSSKLVTRVVELSENDRIKPEIFFECRGLDLPPLERLDFAVLASIFHAMRVGKNLHINGPVSRTLLRNLEEFQEAWAQWRPAYRPVAISAQVELDDAPLYPRRGVFAFSGGVDGSFALIRHHYRHAGRRSCQPVAGMLVHGFDIPLKDADAFTMAETSSRQMLEQFDLPLVVIRTNWKETICSDWEVEFGAGLAACLHQFSGIANCGVVGADEDYAHLELPWGSNPVTNHFLSGGTFEIHTEGSAYTRTERVQLIAEYPEIAKRLRVCWAGPITGRNCGVCEKCVRTKLNFLAIGQEAPCFDTPLTYGQISGIDAGLPIQISYLRDIRSSARARGIKGLWVHLVSLAIAKNQTLAILRKGKAKIRRLFGRAHA